MSKLAQGRLTDSAGGVTVLLMEATTQWAHPEPGVRQTWGWILEGDPSYGWHERLLLELPDGTIAQGPGSLDVTRGRARYDHDLPGRVSAGGQMQDPDTHSPTAHPALRGALVEALGLEYHDERLDPAADRILATLLDRGYTVVRPARVESSRVEDMLVAVRQVWDSAEGDDDTRLRAVVAELVPLIAYQLGRHAGAVAGHRQGLRSRPR